MNKMVIEKLKKITKAIMADANNGIDYDKIDESSRLMEDIGLTSISMLMLVIGIEEEFGIELPIKEASDCKTVGDIVAVIEKCL
ncbi:MAG: acyl carrier protein [Clostridia bacterium]|nr:acyl carrier protein [Clostridia bacterium]